ncbi:MAG TPA: inositol monophosphatase family protein [Acidimicrobiales bacterium]|nr:inositol monophosphatase family protein [Acidimicrobiales bacterium]
MGPRLDDDLALALRLADAADELTMAAFTGAAVAHEIKPDGSPVSSADLAVERRIAEILATERPADGLLGEEVGESGPADRRWIVDGIDGTVLFVVGRTGWGTQVALEVDGEPVVGVTTVPTGTPAGWRRWWAARGAGAWRRGDATGPEGERIRVSATATLAGGRHTAIPPIEALDGERRAAVERLAAAGSAYVDPHEHGALMVADGRADVCVQAGGGPWDFAALAVLVTEAGGRFGDLAGRPGIYGGGPVLFSNGHVHDAATGALQRGA